MCTWCWRKSNAKEKFGRQNVANERVSVIYIQDFWAICACPEKHELPWNVSMYWNIFIIQNFWATCAYPKKHELPWYFSQKWNIFIIQDFWVTGACPENRVCPENFQDRGGGRPPNPFLRTPMAARFRHQLHLSSIATPQIGVHRRLGRVPDSKM